MEEGKLYPQKLKSYRDLVGMKSPENKVLVGEHRVDKLNIELDGLRESVVNRITTEVAHKLDLEILNALQKYIPEITLQNAYRFADRLSRVPIEVNDTLVCEKLILDAGTKQEVCIMDIYPTTTDIAPQQGKFKVTTPYRVY